MACHSLKRGCKQLQFCRQCHQSRTSTHGLDLKRRAAPPSAEQEYVTSSSKKLSLALSARPVLLLSELWSDALDLRVFQLNIDSAYMSRRRRTTWKVTFIIIWTEASHFTERSQQPRYRVDLPPLVFIAALPSLCSALQVLAVRVSSGVQSEPGAGGPDQRL